MRMHTVLSCLFSLMFIDRHVKMRGNTKGTTKGHNKNFARTFFQRNFCFCFFAEKPRSSESMWNAFSLNKRSSHYNCI